MNKLELNVEEGKEIWEKIKPIVITLLTEEVNKLNEKLSSEIKEDNNNKPIQTTMF